MAYTKVGPFTNGSASPPINAAFLNGVETALAAVTIPAPAPSGGDDTSTLQTLLNTAQATGGTLQLQAGTYKANLATSQSFTQPRIIGQGMNLTTIQGTVSTSPVIRMKGGSGGQSGGYLADFSITAASGGGGVGLQLADACGVKWSRIHFTGTLAEGIQFYNESTGGYAEYNSGDAVFEPAVVLPVHYKVGSGNTSFHGSGLTQGTLINQTSTQTGPMIQIDSSAFVYGSPLTAALFPGAAATNLIVNANSGQFASFYGNLDIEAQSAGPNYIASLSGNRVLYSGGVHGLAASNLKLGNLYLVDKNYYVGGYTFPTYKSFKRTTTMAAGTTNVLPDNIGTCLVQIDIVAANYHYAYLLHCWQSPYDATGVVTQLANPKSLNTAGLGAPTFSWSSYSLQVANASYSSSVTAYVSVSPMFNPINSDVFAQQ